MIQSMLLDLKRRGAKLALFIVLLSLSGAFVAVSAGLWGGASQSATDTADAFATIAYRNDIPRDNIFSLFQSFAYDWDDIWLAYAYWQGGVDSDLIEKKKGMTEEILESGQVYAMVAEKAPQVLQTDHRQVAFGYSPELLARVPVEDGVNANFSADMYRLTVLLAEYREENQLSKDDPANDGTLSYFDVVDAVSVHPGTELPSTIALRMLNMPAFQEGLYLLFGDNDLSLDGVPSLWERSTPMFDDIDRDLEMPLYLPNGLEAFALEEPEMNDALRLLVECLDITYHSVQLFGTDNLYSILPFATREAMIVQGRDFDAAEYTEGSDVCLIPAGLAKENGLTIGDTVSLKVYRGNPLTTNNVLWLSGLYGASVIFYESDGVLGSGIEEEKTYTIVGIYQAPEWQIADHALTPNTLIVPNNSLEKVYFGIPLGIFYSLMLENGSIPAFEETLAELGSIPEFEETLESDGLAGEFSYYDQGYAYAAGAVETMRENAKVLLVISLLIWLVVLLFFVFFYVLRTQKDSAILRTLGASKMQAFAYGMLGIAIITLVSGCVGGGIGLTVYGHAADAAFKAALQQNQANMAFSDLVLHDTGAWFSITKAFDVVVSAAILQCLGVLCVAAVCCAVITRKRLLRVLRSSET